ncbi:antitoxin [Paraconexibacter sp. AEG42_29]|uniref:FitA-like ribbon-helix-helix domain-containing protein n=1 Tax=Paraconexibacter sp. AEG42_29 TaxID=2997339 RepID=UPI00339DA59A
MANVHVRDIPDDVHAALKARAAAEGRSVNEVIVRALRRTAQRPTPEQFADQMRRQRTTSAPPTAAVAAAVREGRPPS